MSKKLAHFNIRWEELEIFKPELTNGNEMFSVLHADNTSIRSFNKRYVKIS